MNKASGNDLSSFGTHTPRGLVARLVEWTRGAGSDWAGRRRAYVMRRLATKLLHGAPLDLETLGARMRLYPYNNVCEKRIAFTPQYFDAPERELLRSRIHERFVFVDIGANVGGYSLFVAANSGPQARILAIEPQPEIFERLIYNIRQNPFANLKAIDCAVSDEDGEVTLFIDRGNRGETSMRIVGAESGQLRVPSKRLSTIVTEEGYEHIDAIKLDVEGAEDLILEPFFREAPRAVWPKLVVMEYLHRRWAVDLPALLTGYGYREIQRTRANVAWELGA